MEFPQIFNDGIDGKIVRKMRAESGVVSHKMIDSSYESIIVNAVILEASILVFTQ